jgi:hypothetical protein
VSQHVTQLRNSGTVRGMGLRRTLGKLDDAMLGKMPATPEQRIAKLRATAACGIDSRGGVGMLLTTVVELADRLEIAERRLAELEERRT